MTHPSDIKYFYNFATASQRLAQFIGIKINVMRILHFENLRNFLLRKDSIVVLARIAWATLLYLLTGFLKANRRCQTQRSP